MSRYLAFVHIEKAAGTTLIHVLRRSFFLRYLDVRPLRPNTGELFHAVDLQESLRVNPWIRAFGGHAVRPFGDLEDSFPDIQYITVLRDPVNRFLSMYRFGVAVLRRDHTFEQFLTDERMHNFQTVKIAGSQDLDKAKDILRTRFLCVGTVERLDEFLVLLTEVLRPWRFRPAYEIRNVGPKVTRADPLLAEHGERIRDANALDIELYDFVTGELARSQKEAYGPDFERDYQAFLERSGMSIPNRAMYYVDGLYRKLYCEPVTGLVRKLRGLAMKGSY